MAERSRSATVAALFRYPVKSFQGLRVESLRVGRRGVVGDRRYAVVDVATERIVSAKHDPRLLHAHADEGVDGTVRLRLPDGTEVLADDPSADHVLSRWLGRPVRLVASDDRPDDEALAYDERSRSYEMTFDPPDDAAELVAIPSPSGTFLDLAAVHVLTTGSIERCRERSPGIGWDRRRFRPNVLVELDDGGFAEDAWIGAALHVGAVGLRVTQATVRCAMPLRAQPGGITRDTEVFRTLRDLHDNHLGVYCDVRTAGVVRVGDPVEPVDQVEPDGVA